MPVNSYDDDDDKDSKDSQSRTLKDFDCPDCNANNPADPPVGDGDELLCNYCGSTFLLKVTAEGRIKFKST